MRVYNNRYITLLSYETAHSTFWRHCCIYFEFIVDVFKISYLLTGARLCQCKNWKSSSFHSVHLALLFNMIFITIIIYHHGLLLFRWLQRVQLLNRLVFCIRWMFLSSSAAAFSHRNFASICWLINWLLLYLFVHLFPYDISATILSLKWTHKTAMATVLIPKIYFHTLLSGWLFTRNILDGSTLIEELVHGEPVIMV